MTSKNEVFVRDVASVINRLSLENGSNTPDYLLAEYLWDCLQAFNTAVYSRDKRHPVKQGETTPESPYPRCACGAHEWGPNTTRITDSHGQEHYREKCASQVKTEGSPSA